MKQKLLQRALLGFPLGIAIGHVITILISLLWAQDHYSPYVPSLVQATGSEINAVVFQAFLTGVLGSVCSASALIWEMEHWSIAKQTGAYFASISLAMLPIAYLTHWMEHSLRGFLIYLGVFVSIFVVIWCVQYWKWRYQLKKMNSKLG